MALGDGCLGTGLGAPDVVRSDLKRIGGAVEQRISGPLLSPQRSRLPFGQAVGAGQWSSAGQNFGVICRGLRKTDIIVPCYLGIRSKHKYGKHLIGSVSRVE